MVESSLSSKGVLKSLKGVKGSRTLLDDALSKYGNKNEPTNTVNHLDDVYGDLHKLDERIQEIQKLVDNSKEQ